ncbi:Protein of unknown function, partial [Gryllus bimaculatus]
HVKCYEGYLSVPVVQLSSLSWLSGGVAGNGSHVFIPEIVGLVPYIVAEPSNHPSIRLDVPGKPRHAGSCCPEEVVLAQTAGSVQSAGAVQTAGSGQPA